MQKLLRQLMLIGLLIVNLILLLLPAGIAQAATRMPNQPTRPTSYGVPLSGTGVSAAQCQDGSAYYAYTATDHHLDVVPITGGLNRVYTNTSPSAPSITCWNNKVWIAWRADDSSRTIHVADVTDAFLAGDPYRADLYQLPYHTILPNGQSTDGSPGIAGVDGGNLYVAYRWTGNSGHMTVNESRNGQSDDSWFNQTTITNSVSRTEPALVSYNGNVVIVWGGTNSPSPVMFANYSDGNSYLTECVTKDTTYGSGPIGVSTFKEQMLLAFDQSGNGSQIYTGSWSSSSPCSSYVHQGPVAGNADQHTGVGLAGLNVYYVDTSGSLQGVQILDNY